MKSTTVIASTTKGHRVFLEGVRAAMPQAPQGYNVVFDKDTITILFSVHGKRVVVASKGGVIDLQSRKVTTWAQGATVAHVRTTDNAIVITRG